MSTDTMIERLNSATKLQTGTKDEKAHFCDMVRSDLPDLVSLCRRQADEIEALKNTAKALENLSENRQQLINRFTTEANVLRQKITAQTPEIIRLRTAAWTAVRALQDAMKTE